MAHLRKGVCARRGRRNLVAFAQEKCEHVLKGHVVVYREDTLRRHPHAVRSKNTNAPAGHLHGQRRRREVVARTRSIAVSPETQTHNRVEGATLTAKKG